MFADSTIALSPCMVGASDVLNKADLFEWEWCRRHAQQQEVFNRGREEIRILARARGGRVSYPEALYKAPEPMFHLWFVPAVREAQRLGEEVPNEILNMMAPPALDATAYRSMFAFGNHIRVSSAEYHLTTCDSGVAAAYTTVSRSSTRDRNPTTSVVEYVGVVEEILALNYGAFEVVVLVCSWVRANLRPGPTQTMKRDEMGFTLVNLHRMMPISANSFALPMHVEQIFFGRDGTRSGWNVVLRKDPRGRRIYGASEDHMEVTCLADGGTVEHTGLNPSMHDEEA